MFTIAHPAKDVENLKTFLDLYFQVVGPITQRSNIAAGLVHQSN